MPRRNGEFADLPASSRRFFSLPWYHRTATSGSLPSGAVSVWGKACCDETE